MYVDLTHTSSFTSSVETLKMVWWGVEPNVPPTLTNHATSPILSIWCSANLARRHEPLTKSPAHHLERLVEENTMDSGIMARLEVEDPLLACHDQTAGWLNRVWVESGR